MKSAKASASREAAEIRLNLARATEQEVNNNLGSRFSRYLTTFNYSFSAFIVIGGFLIEHYLQGSREISDEMQELQKVALENNEAKISILREMVADEKANASKEEERLSQILIDKQHDLERASAGRDASDQKFNRVEMFADEAKDELEEMELRTKAAADASYRIATTRELFRGTPFENVPAVTSTLMENRKIGLMNSDLKDGANENGDKRTELLGLFQKGTLFDDLRIAVLLAGIKGGVQFTGIGEGFAKELAWTRVRIEEDLGRCIEGKPLVFMSLKPLQGFGEGVLFTDSMVYIYGSSPHGNVAKYIGIRLDQFMIANVEIENPIYAKGRDRFEMTVINDDRVSITADCSVATFTASDFIAFERSLVTRQATASNDHVRPN